MKERLGSLLGGGLIGAVRLVYLLSLKRVLDKNWCSLTLMHVNFIFVYFMKLLLSKIAHNTTLMLLRGDSKNVLHTCN